MLSSPPCRVSINFPLRGARKLQSSLILDASRTGFEICWPTNFRLRGPAKKIKMATSSTDPVVGLGDLVQLGRKFAYLNSWGFIFPPELPKPKAEIRRLGLFAVSGEIAVNDQHPPCNGAGLHPPRLALLGRTFRKRRGAHTRAWHQKAVYRLFN